MPELSAKEFQLNTSTVVELLNRQAKIDGGYGREAVKAVLQENGSSLVNPGLNAINALLGAIGQQMIRALYFDSLYPSEFRPK